jgi:bifunctional UDP-N-acetylglucosamine pyrophosphorylase/glucosamine-1-phosphate N-acetyltransferase
MKTIIFSDSVTEESGSPDNPRFLWDLMGRPVLSYALDLAEALSDQVPAVLSEGDPSRLRDAFPDRSVDWRERQGSDVLSQCADLVEHEDVDPSEPVLFLRPDTPLVRAGDLKELLACHDGSGASLTLLSGTGEDGFPCTLEEQPDAEAIDAGAQEGDAPPSDVAYATDVGVIRAEALVRATSGDDLQNSDSYARPALELTRRLMDEEYGVDVYNENDPADTVRIRTAEELSEATERLRKRVLSMLVEQGVKVLSPAQTYVEPDVNIGKGTVIEPFVVVRNGVEVGANCHLGPFCHLRAGTILEDRAEIGNYVETKNSRVGKGTKAKHLSYLGDATLGDDVNIGAGTITANYDGTNKHRTTIEDDASTGSNTVLIAPVTMKEGSKTGAGAVVARGQDVEKGDTVVGVPARRLDSE